MKRTHFYVVLAVVVLASAWAFFWGSGPCRADDYRRLAEGLSKALRTRGVKRLAISDFIARGAAEEEARYAQRRLSEALFREPGIGLMDAAVLDTLDERGRLWTQALIKGEVYPTDTGVAVVVKALNPRDGRLLGAMQIETVHMGDGEDGDLRDAVGGASPACSRLMGRLEEANRGAVDLKARYWAARVRRPDFSYAELDRFPGSEFRDYASRQEFYRLINLYYSQAAPVILTNGERSALDAISSLEASAAAECSPERRTTAP